MIKFKYKKHFQEYLPHYKKNLLLALPIMLSQLGNAIVMLSDTLMVGRIGKNELAAVAFGNAIYIVGFVLIQGITFGSTPLIGASYSAGKHRYASEQFANSLIVDLLSFVGVGSLMWLASYAMPYMGQDEAVWQLATPYYRVLVLSLIPYVVFFAFKQYMEGLGNTRYSMNITLICCFLNVILNYVFIFGKFGAPKMGVFGAGFATLIARATMPILYILLFRWKSSLWRHFFFFNTKVLKWEEMKKLGKVGLPIGGQMFIECFAFSCSAVMAGWFGAAALAGHEIAMNMSSLTFMLVTGISSGTTISVSHQKGINNKNGIRKAGNAALQLGICYSITCALTMAIGSKFLPTLFTNDTEVLEIASLLLLFAAVYQIPDGLQSISIGALRGIADVRMPMYVCSFCYLAVNLPFSYLVAVKMGVGITGIWMGFIIGLGAVATIMIIRWHLKTKRQSK